jgi:tetratricopeptide (TPR) repeat protein
MDARVARLRDLFAQDPSNAELACELADALLAQSAIGDARQVLESLPMPAAAMPGVSFRLGRCALAGGDYAAAEAVYATLAADGVDAAPLAHDLAFAQLCQRKAEAALATARGAIRRFGTDPALVLVQARAQSMLGAYRDAVSSLDALLSAQPTHAGGAGVRALALLDAGEPEAAAEAANAALALDADQHEALMVAATIALWHRDAAAARALSGRGLARHPNSGRMRSLQGQALMLEGDIAGGRAALERAVAAMPDHIGTWHALAWTQLLQADRDSAEGSFRSAYALDRNFADTHGGLALVAALRGQYEEAEQEAKVALRLDPQAVTARYARTLLLEARGETAEAEALMATLLHEIPGAGLPVREFAGRLRATLGAPRP